MKVYFERALGKILLYRAERSQLSEVRKWWESGQNKDWEGRNVGDCYGGEHLARLLGKSLLSPYEESGILTMPSQHARIDCTNKHGCAVRPAT